MEFTHFDNQGSAIMVDVSGKQITHRVAVACGKIQISAPVMEAIRTGSAKKGDVLGLPVWRALWRPSAQAN